MKLSNSIYDILKWVTLALIPACSSLYVGLSAVWGWPYAEEVAKTATVVCAFLGAIIGVSTINYYNDNGGE